MLFQWRASVQDVGPTLKQHWVNDTCLLGYNWMHVSKSDNTYYLGILYRAIIDPFRNHYTAIIWVKPKIGVILHKISVPRT